MTTTGTNNEPLDSTQIELENRYRNEFPGFEPATWAAMAYYSKGYAFEDVRLLLAKRFGDDLIAKRDALVREALEAGSSAYNPNPDPDPIFEIEDVTDKVPSIPE
jgi:hypothetical protein